MTAIEPSPLISPSPSAEAQGAQSGVLASTADPRVGDGDRTADSERRRNGAAFVTTLPLRLDVKIPMPNFRLKDLTHIAIGQMIESEWSVAEDLPVSVGDVKLLWAEFAVADQQLTVRVTRIA